MPTVFDRPMGRTRPLTFFDLFQNNFENQQSVNKFVNFEKVSLFSKKFLFFRNCFSFFETVSHFSKLSPRISGDQKNDPRKNVGNLRKVSLFLRNFETEGGRNKDNRVLSFEDLGFVLRFKNEERFLQVFATSLGYFAG